jgi:hypothetical protein
MLERIEEETLVPVVGPDLLTVSHEGRETLLYPLLASRLAERLGVSEAGLPPGLELQEVARRHLTRSRDVQEIYQSLRVVFRDLEPIPVPEPLTRLAKISRIKLFVTTTFDVLTERAVDQERYSGVRQTLSFAYAPSDKQDLPPELDRLNRPAVYHLMGRLSGTPHSYALTREDALEFTQSLSSKMDDAPGYLFDKLRRSDLLILGTPVAYWLARLFMRNARGGRETGAPAELDVEPGGNPVLFVRRRGGGSELCRGLGAPEFVNELYRRWIESSPAPDPEPPPIGKLLSSPQAQLGAVFLSCARADRDAAESIRDALDRAGVDVIVDDDDLQLPDRWEKKLRGFVSDCSLFVPVISARSLSARRRFFRAEWVEAILDAGRAAPSGRFILPVVIDETSAKERAMPGEFGELSWERLPDGRPSSELVKTIVELQRSYRSRRFA